MTSPLWHSWGDDFYRWTKKSSVFPFFTGQRKPVRQESGFSQGKRKSAGLLGRYWVRKQEAGNDGVRKNEVKHMATCIFQPIGLCLACAVVYRSFLFVEKSYVARRNIEQINPIFFKRSEDFLTVGQRFSNFSRIPSSQLSQISSSKSGRLSRWALAKSRTKGLLTIVI